MFHVGRVQEQRCSPGKFLSDFSPEERKVKDQVTKYEKVQTLQLAEEIALQQKTLIMFPLTLQISFMNGNFPPITNINRDPYWSEM